MEKFTIKEALSFGWQKTKKHFWYLALILIGSGIFFTILDALTNDRGFFPNLIAGILGILVELALIKLSLKILSDEKLGTNDLIPSWRIFWSYLTASILYTVIVFGGLILLFVSAVAAGFSTTSSGDYSFGPSLGLLLLGGLVVLSIAVVYFAVVLGLKYSQYAYLIVDKGMGPIEALKESGNITSGLKGRLLLMWLSIVGVIILGALALVVGLLWAIPTAMIAWAYVYRKLADSVMPATVQPTTPMTTTPAQG